MRNFPRNLKKLTHSLVCQLVFLGIAFLSSSWVSVWANGQECPAKQYSFPVLQNQLDLPREQSRGQIYELDNQPLGNRLPLLLIHGGTGENQPCFRWYNFLNRTRHYPEFSKRYKVYLYRYNSSKRLEKLSLELQKSLLDLYEYSEDKPITIAALSLGGNLTQVALGNPIVSSTVDTVLTMGTPFHGSPLFSQEWFESSLDRHPLFPISKNFHALGYRLYFKGHANYLADLKWDNLDSLIPEIDRFEIRTTKHPVNYAAAASNTQLAMLNAGVSLDKSKFITYAGYLENHYHRTLLRRILENTIGLPYTLVVMKLPLLLGHNNSVLKLLSKEMSRVRINHQASHPAANPHIYKFNDGITPVTSAIFLSPEALRECPLLTTKNLDDLRFVVDVRLARVFHNVSHISFMDGVPLKGWSSLIRDELHPESGKKKILDWAIEDLLYSHPLLEEQDIKLQVKAALPLFPGMVLAPEALLQ